MLATVEPWHGKSIVIYAEQPGVWSRTVIESELTGGHALGWADFDGDGSDELAAGWRDAPKPGVAIYAVDREGALKSKTMIDDGGMATEDLVVGRLERRQAARHRGLGPRHAERQDLLERDGEAGEVKSLEQEIRRSGVFWFKE